MIIPRQHLIVQSFVSSWDSGIVVVPVLVQLVRVEVRGELRSNQTEVSAVVCSRISLRVRVGSDEEYLK